MTDFNTNYNTPAHTEISVAALMDKSDGKQVVGKHITSGMLRMYDYIVNSCGEHSTGFIYGMEDI